MLYKYIVQKVSQPLNTCSKSLFISEAKAKKSTSWSAVIDFGLKAFTLNLLFGRRAQMFEPQPHRRARWESLPVSVVGFETAIGIG